MENQNINLKPMQAIHLAMCIAPALLLAIVSILRISKADFTEPGPSNDPFYVVAPAMALAALIIAKMMFKKQLAAIETAATLSEKIAKYQAAFIIRQGLVEGAALFNIIVYFLTGHFIFAVIALALILFMFTFRPTKFRVIEDLQLNYTDLN